MEVGSNSSPPKSIDYRRCILAPNLMEPIVSWANSDYGQKAVNMLKQGLGQVRKQEGYHTDRTYYPRILKQWEFYEKGQ